MKYKGEEAGIHPTAQASLVLPDAALHDIMGSPAAGATPSASLTKLRLHYHRLQRSFETWETDSGKIRSL